MTKPMTGPKLMPVAYVWPRFFRPIEAASWAALAVALALTFQLPLSIAEQEAMVALALAMGAYMALYFRWLLPRFPERVWIHTLIVVAGVVVIACAEYVLSRHGARLDLVYTIVLALGGVTSGLGLAIAGAVLAFVASVASEALIVGFSPLLPLTHGIQLLGFLIIGYLSSFMANVIRQQNWEAAGRNRELALLLEANRTVTASLNLYETLPRLAERIAAGLPATFCRICLVDRQERHLVTYGVYPLRPIAGWRPSLGQRCALASLPRHREAIESGLPVIVRQDDPGLCMAEKECSALYFFGLKSACLVPIVFEHTTLGIICVGEERNWKRVAFDDDKLSLLQALASQVGVVINNSRLHQSTQRQVERTAVLNEVARAIGSTIELKDLLELIYKQLSRVVPTDTYYVGLYDQRDQALDLVVVIDGGHRFPPSRIPAGAGLVSIVVSTRRPLLIRCLSEELDKLPVKPRVVGEEKVSESWLGVPMMVGDAFLGLLAVASYQTHAFDEEDVALLANVAAQAALTLDNARHHAEVEEQAHRDSLTGVYNHGYLLQRLGEAIAKASGEETLVSLIMLDIDHFKAYNDSYGHVIGDEALCLTVQAIRAHVKATDTVGRWGGEEFGIVLPGANADSALRIAQRVRETLASLKLSDGHGGTLPNPTVSQGIAAYPTHAADADTLVNRADAALYRAKSSGRDQVALAAS
jgi:diguanylate cyclase (GGDEF)-like protein